MAGNGTPRVVAITGSSGRIGAAAARSMAAAGWRVRGADRSPGPWTGIVGDLRDRRVRHDLVQAADVVIHAAALHAPHVGTVDDDEFRAVNVGATAALLADAEAGGVRRFVYLSSTSVYGHALVPSDRAVWVDEGLEPQPRDIYDETKLAAEELVAGSPVSAVTLRIARCFPEPVPVAAIRLLHRSVRLADVVDAIVSAAVREGVGGTFVVAGRYPFRRSDCVGLYRDAAGVIAERAPAVAAAFRERGWPLPARIDRVYDSGAARTALAHQPAEAALQLLRTNPTS